MPLMKNTSSVAIFSASKNSGVNMLPSRAITAISSRFAPPNSCWCFR